MFGKCRGQLRGMGDVFAKKPVWFTLLEEGMPTYQFEAQHDDGRTIRGTEFGASAEQVVQNLALKGMLVSKIEEAVSGFDPIPRSFSSGEAPVAKVAPLVASPVQNSSEEPAENPRGYFATQIWGPLVGGVPLQNLAIFYRQLAAMQNAAVPMVTALESLASQANNSRLNQIILEMRDGSREGKPLSDVMQRYPEVFSALQVSLIRAGEEGGFQQKAASLLATYIEDEIEIRNEYRKNTFYPKAVVIGSILIISGANAIIQSIGRGGKIYSPLTDPAIVGFLIPLLVFGFLFWKVGLANPRIRYNYDAFLLKIPYLGTTLQQFSMAKFGRALGALYKGGVAVPKAIQLSADSCGNEYLRSQIHPAARRLEEGHGIAVTLRGTQAFSPMVLDMVTTGETTGELDGMLNKVADFYEAEAKVRAKQLATAVGFVALIVVGIYVGFVVINFFTGYSAQITDSVRERGAGGE